MIPDTFKKYGAVHELISTIGPYKIYRRHDSGRNRSCSYEIMKPIMIKGELCLPGSSFWGIYGWTCIDEIDVIRVVQKILKRDTGRDDALDVALNAV